MAIIKNIKHRSGRPVNGVYTFIESSTDIDKIRILIENGYDVREVFEDGSEIVLNFSNYDNCNYNPKKETLSAKTEKIEPKDIVSEDKDPDPVQEKSEEAIPEQKNNNKSYPKQFKKKN